MAWRLLWASFDIFSQINHMRIRQRDGRDLARLTLSDVAEMLSEAAGRTVQYRDLPEAEYREAPIGAGVPTGFAAALAEYSAKAVGGILADRSRTSSRLI
jgi:uncharacterized protein YbjT (DUF2867 family)